MLLKENPLCLYLLIINNSLKPSPDGPRLLAKFYFVEANTDEAIL